MNSYEHLKGTSSSASDGMHFEDECCAITLVGFVETDGAPAAVAAARLYREQGIGGLSALRGHFGASVVDHARAETYLLCDSVGSWPLYYAPTPDGWAWGDHLSALLPHVQTRQLDPAGLNEVCYYRWLLGESTLVEGVSQVLPSHWVRLRAGRPPESGRHTAWRFKPNESLNRAEAVAQIEAALNRYFAGLRQRHASIGILLSGGVDSSLLAAKAVEFGFDKIVAATARFPGHESPELERAIRVARRLGLELRIVDVPDSLIARRFPAFVWQTEEPPRHYSGLALSQIFSETNGEVPVFVSGEGADTMFGPDEICGLAEFQRRREQRVEWMPVAAQRAICALLPTHGQSRLRALARQFRYTTREFLFQLTGIAQQVSSPVQSAFTGITSDPRPAAGVLSLLDPDADVGRTFQEYELYTMSRSNALKYSRLAAPYGLSVEMPFLSHGVASVGLELPARLKLDGNLSKPLLRQICANYIPREWIDAPKLGFASPLAAWLRGPLAARIAMLEEERASRRGLYRLDAIRKMSPERDGELLWTAISLEMFLRQFIDGEGAGAA
jgi:asparagine synthase (glutamine-hydrolysing)